MQTQLQQASKQASKQKETAMRTYLSKIRKARKTQTKLHGVEKVALPTTVASNHRISAWRKGLNVTLLSERPKIANGDAFDVHGDGYCIVVVAFRCFVRSWLLPRSSFCAGSAAVCCWKQSATDLINR